VNTKVVLITLRRNAHSSESLEAERQRCALLVDPRVAELPADAIAAALDTSRDVVRARSNAVACALRVYPELSHILFWDDDVILPSLQTVPRLLNTGYDVVGLPVPRKHIARWGDERTACDFCYRLQGEDGGTHEVQADEKGCVEVDALPFGLMLVSAGALKSMITQYREELWYKDGGHEAVALFQLVLSITRSAPDGTRFRELLSEDYSFAYRWRAMGGKVYMLLDAASHVGSHVFRGHISGLRYVR
jgi:hypothetical protein